MTRAKRQAPVHSNRNKPAHQGNAAAKTACQATLRVPHAPITAEKRQQTASRQPGRPQSKQTRIIVMLQTRAGATVDAIMHATGWQQHSVRGLLAGVIRKKLGLNLVSEASENGRVYRLAGHAASSAAAAKTSRAA